MDAIREEEERQKAEVQREIETLREQVRALHMHLKPRG